MESRRDSSSMKTIAILTLVFLPGTYVAVGPLPIILLDIRFSYAKR